MKEDTKVNVLTNITMLKHKLLYDAYLNHRLIAFRTPAEEWGETVVGYVKELTAESITVSEINEYGFPIGFTTFKVESLIDIMIDDKTLKCLEFIKDNCKQFSSQKCTTFWGNGPEIRERIFDRMKDKKIITLFLEDGEDDNTDVIGFIEDIDEKSVLVEIVNSYGENDGLILIPIDTITGVRWESMENQARLLLYQKRQTKDR